MVLTRLRHGHSSDVGNDVTIQGVFIWRVSDSLELTANEGGLLSLQKTLRFLVLMHPAHAFDLLLLLLQTLLLLAQLLKSSDLLKPLKFDPVLLSKLLLSFANFDLLLLNKLFLHFGFQFLLPLPLQFNLSVLDLN